MWHKIFSPFSILMRFGNDVEFFGIQHTFFPDLNNKIRGSNKRIRWNINVNGG